MKHTLLSLTLGAGVALLLAASATAQPVVNPTEHLSFDRPEAWALKYFTSATLLGGVDTPQAPAPGSVSLGLELGWLPSLSTTQRIVGFNGTKPEDLNKAPLFFRPRVTIGLPQRFALTVAVVPPMRMFGVKPRLLAVAVDRPVWETSAWSVGVRAAGQIGTVEGAYTCPASVLGFAPGSAGNLYGCQAQSSDTASLRFASGAVNVAYRPAASPKLSPHAAVAINYMDVGFQVDALTFGYLDRTHYLSRGATFSASGGLTYSLTRQLAAGVDLFYTPLLVQRVTAGATRNEGFFNIRALLVYRLR
jgi:hypothetical protein